MANAIVGTHACAVGLPKKDSLVTIRTASRNPLNLPAFLLLKSKMMNWININEKLPADEEKVLVAVRATHNNNKFIEMAKLTEGQWRKCDGLLMHVYKWEVTHWMPLPELPGG